MDMKDAIRVNAYPQNYSADEVRRAQLAILAAVATAHRSRGPVVCPLCNEPQPQEMPESNVISLAWKRPFDPPKIAPLVRSIDVLPCYDRIARKVVKIHRL